MNEAEIVDVALGILIEITDRQTSTVGKSNLSVSPAFSSTQQDRKQEKPSERPPLAGADKPELSPASSAEDRSEDGDSGDIGLPPGSPPPGPASSDPACSGSPGEDQDALKYVREIFFS
ncbi:Cell cycle regulator of non-homologous end joining [Camelus dromedarius]|uniref:Cell cycle regulator of non-homologous end joining n=1 Tax=Camelus dromedarius TaxID=9838 RepID=A0A5N4DXN4_CAMDR|nr:Cell cycle regulator of non-homologous end joining [Camelus dromedarius]